jgi:arabinan endo-1,5-alpha-L-arabinosidase
MTLSKHWPIICYIVLFVLPGHNLPAYAAPPTAHDPAIIKQGEYYYLFTTSRGISIKRSRDLIEWEYAGMALQPAPEWASEQVPKFDGNIWAPDIACVEGKYYLYYSISSFGKNRSRIGLAINETLEPDDPNYKWEDRGPVIKSEPYNKYNAIDPNLTRDTEGRYWVSFGSFWSGIKLVEVDPATGAPLSDPLELISLASRPGVRYNPIEAPFIIFQNGYYYLFVSFDFCCRGLNSTYKIAVGRSEQITGPYLDRKGNDMMRGGGTMVLEGSEDYAGVGHNAVLQEGDKDWLVFHAYSVKRGGRALLQIRPIIWTDDGWPTVGDPLE